MQGCIEILNDFEIINYKKYKELQKRVEAGDKEAYAEISKLLEEVTSSIDDIAEEEKNAS